MAKYRNQLPQLSDRFFITTGGLETTLVYREKIELPCFAAFHVLKDESGCQWLKNYLVKFVKIAQKYELGIILISPTWRASPDWLRKIGYSDQDIFQVNRKAIDILSSIRDEYETEKCPIVIAGSIGPRGDGYNPTMVMSPDEAQKYHATQIGIMSETNADMITAFTLNYLDEAIGMARAAKKVGIPIVISFTVENDGKLPTGQTLKQAIELVDEATQSTPVYYMVNCAHPSSVAHALVPGETWLERIHGIQGNASKKTHAELDKSTEIDAGNPAEFAKDNQALLHKLKNLNVLGGCCGTDDRHVEEICKACIITFDQLRHHDQRQAGSQ